MVELGDAINYTRNLFVGENASAGEAQAAIEQAFGAAVAIERCVGIHGLHVHGAPQAARLDILGFESLAQVFGRELKAVAEENCGEPEIGNSIGSRLGVHGDSGQRSQALGVESVDFAAASYALGDVLHLSAAYSGADVAETVVVANLLVIIVGHRLTRLSGEELHMALILVIRADECTSTRGGDDFVAITNDDIDYEAICQDIIAEFDVEVLKLFNDTDIERKYIEVQNRKGIVEQFPLTSISIGVVVADAKRFSNILEIGEVGAQVKHLSKTTMGSSYAIDRREEND